MVRDISYKSVYLVGLNNKNNPSHNAIGKHIQQIDNKEIARCPSNLVGNIGLKLHITITSNLGKPSVHLANIIRAATGVPSGFMYFFS